MKKKSKIFGLALCVLLLFLVSEQKKRNELDLFRKQNFFGTEAMLEILKASHPEPILLMLSVFSEIERNGEPSHIRDGSRAVFSDLFEHLRSLMCIDGGNPLLADIDGLLPTENLMCSTSPLSDLRISMNERKPNLKIHGTRHISGLSFDMEIKLDPLMPYDAVYIKDVNIAVQARARIYQKESNTRHGIKLRNSSLLADEKLAFFGSTRGLLRKEQPVSVIFLDNSCGSLSSRATTQGSIEVSVSDIDVSPFIVNALLVDFKNLPDKTVRSIFVAGRNAFLAQPPECEDYINFGPHDLVFDSITTRLRDWLVNGIVTEEMLDRFTDDMPGYRTILQMGGVRLYLDNLSNAVPELSGKYKVTKAFRKWVDLYEQKITVAPGRNKKQSTVEARGQTASDKTISIPERGGYMVINLFAGPNAVSYPVDFLTAVPEGGWTDEHKTNKLVLRRIPAGTFAMGSPPDEFGRDEGREAQRQVTLTKDFYIGVFEVTQRQWELVMGNRPSGFANVMYYATRPVEQVSYCDVREKTHKNSIIRRKWPQTRAAGANSFVGKLREKTKLETLDLPTEAQWEYACRAGRATAINSGKNLKNLRECSNMSEAGRYYFNHPGGRFERNYGSTRSSYNLNVSTEGGTAKAGSYFPNAWGLYDMHGNVSEWCLDWYTKTVPRSVDPDGTASGSLRVVRGGSWDCGARYLRSACRQFNDPNKRSITIGFRLSCTLP